jgi:hypothetical protein
MFDAPIYICVQNMAFRIVIGITTKARRHEGNETRPSGMDDRPQKEAFQFEPVWIGEAVGAGVLVEFALPPPGC